LCDDITSDPRLDWSKLIEISPERTSLAAKSNFMIGWLNMLNLLIFLLGKVGSLGKKVASTRLFFV